jgi:protein-disulfide isomerase
MASRKEQKEAARQRRIAEEQARAAQARRSRRLRMLAGVVIGAAAVVAVAIAISSGGSSSGGLVKANSPAQTKLVNQVNALLKGIPQSGNVLGNPKAPVTMTYFGDLECPICRDFTVDGGFPELVAKDVRDGKVKVVYNAFETATRDPSVFKDQQIAALAAGKQKKFWNFAELFYHQQGQEDTNYVNEQYLTTLANQSGLHLPTWKSDRGDPALATELTSQVNSGNAQGIQGTPTLIFQGPKGKAQAQSAVPAYSELKSKIQQVS